jgi:hypothetical protein
MKKIKPRTKSNFALTFLMLVCTGNCDGTNYVLANASESKEKILEVAFNYAKAKDGSGIEKLILNRKEHNEMFWNHVGEKFTTDTGMNPDLAFEHMSIESVIAWKELMVEMETRKNISLQKVECKMPSEKYGPFTLYRGCISTLLDKEKNEVFTNKKFRTLIEYKGKYKIYHLKRD